MRAREGAGADLLHNFLDHTGYSNMFIETVRQKPRLTFQKTEDRASPNTLKARTLLYTAQIDGNMIVVDREINLYDPVLDVTYSRPVKLLAAKDDIMMIDWLIQLADTMVLDGNAEETAKLDELWNNPDFAFENLYPEVPMVDFDSGNVKGTLAINPSPKLSWMLARGWLYWFGDLNPEEKELVNGWLGLSGGWLNRASGGQEGNASPSERLNSIREAHRNSMSVFFSALPLLTQATQP